MPRSIRVLLKFKHVKSLRACCLGCSERDTDDWAMQRICRRLGLNIYSRYFVTAKGFPKGFGDYDAPWNEEWGPMPYCPHVQSRIRVAGPVNPGDDLDSSTGMVLSDSGDSSHWDSSRNIFIAKRFQEELERLGSQASSVQSGVPLDPDQDEEALFEEREPEGVKDELTVVGLRPFGRSFK